MGGGGAQDAGGKGAGGFDECRVIEQGEGLHRGVGTVPVGGAFITTGGVKGEQHWMEVSALPVHVDAAAPLVLVLMGLVFTSGEVQIRIIPRGLIRPGAEAADLVDQ